MPTFFQQYGITTLLTVLEPWIKDRKVIIKFQD